jgi:hypothetical protein
MSGSYIDVKLFSKQISFQLVTGMTLIHSTLRGFSKIGLVMLFCRSALVRNSFFFFQDLHFSLSKYAGARACIGRKYIDLTPLRSKHFVKMQNYFLLGSPKLKAQQY